MNAVKLQSPVAIGGTTIRNRLYRAPVLEGAGDGVDTAARLASHFVENARYGVGLIIQGSSCIYPEGRTSPGMTCVDTREKMLRLGPMVDAVHAQGAAIFIQLGHGGLYAMEAWHEPYASNRRGPVLAASAVPMLLRPVFRRVPVHVLTTDEVRAMATRYGDVAAWAREAGYDGVQLGSANAKLLDQFLSPFYNHRTDSYGGSFENRARILRDIRAAVTERAGADYPCLVKLPVETAPPGFRRATREDALRLARLVEEWGFDAVTPVTVSVFPDTTLSRGGVPDAFWTNKGIAARLGRAAPSRRRRAFIKGGAWLGARRSPFTPVWNRDLFVAVKQQAGIPVLAVGGIRTAAEAHEIVESDEADLVGIGRPFYAEPDLAARILAHDPGPGRCRNSNRCVAAQMLGMKGVCYNPDVRKL
jgi:2,4-dienoyl-CoA reductase-like NADH-dependent reductase (Old Yellow Enzyme family)